MTQDKNWLPTRQDIKKYFLLKDMLNAQKIEFDLLSKKKSDGELNKMKIKMVNRVLEPLNKLLINEQTHKFLDILNEDNMPTNSDVVLIISQYKTAIKKFKDNYYKADKYKKSEYGNPVDRWITKERPQKYYESHKDEEEDN